MPKKKHRDALPAMDRELNSHKSRCCPIPTKEYKGKEKKGTQLAARRKWGNECFFIYAVPAADQGNCGHPTKDMQDNMDKKGSGKQQSGVI